MRAIAIIAVLGGTLSWPTATLSDPLLSPNSPESLTSLKTDYSNEWKSSESLGQQIQKLGPEMQSSEFSAEKNEISEDMAGKQVDAKFSSAATHSLASSSAKVQPPSDLSAASTSLQNLSSSSVDSLGNSSGSIGSLGAGEYVGTLSTLD